MSSFPCLVRTVSGAGEVRYLLGHRLVDRYLEFVAGRARPNMLRAVAFDLKAFFAVVVKDPAEVTAVDVLDFLAHQRGDRSVVRLADRESGLSARTIARRLSSVSGLTGPARRTVDDTRSPLRASREIRACSAAEMCVSPSEPTTTRSCSCGISGGFGSITARSRPAARGP